MYCVTWRPTRLDLNTVDENYSCSFTKTGPNKSIYQPDEPENHRKERKDGKGARAREKILATVFSFYSVDFRKKNTAKGHLIFKDVVHWLELLLLLLFLL